MKKKWIAVTALVLCCMMMMTGCISTEGLKKVPQGVRPESLDMAELEPQFPSESSIKNQLMLIATDMKSAQTIDEQREKYNEFLYNAYIYIVGPYNFTHYLAQDGRSISVYYDNVINQMNLLLSEWEPTAWSAISEGAWGAQLKNEYAALMITPDSIRNAYPTADETVSAQLQTMYNAREALATGIDNGFADADLEELLDDLFASRETLADTLQYDSYLDYVVEKLNKMPYDLNGLLTLAQLVRENLVPAVRAAEGASVPQKSDAEWRAALPELAERFPQYSEDLQYVLKNGVYTVEAGEQSRHFAYPLYQYDVSAGKAILSGDEDDVLHVLYGLGLTARDMALEQEQWSMSALSVYDSVQESAFAGMCINELDAVFAEDAEEAKRGMIYLMAKDVCHAAMELELQVQLYANPVMAQSDREQLIAELSEAYGLDGMENYFTESDDLLIGSLDCAGRMLGGLYGLTLHNLDNADSAAADAVLEATLSVYNAANPIATGYNAGLTNPYSTEGIKAVAELVK